MTPLTRTNNFGVLKFVAAFMVIAGHMGHILGAYIPYIFGVGVHEIGVKTFFLIGGYLITYSWLGSPNPVQYAIKRFFRIVPALAFFVVLAIVISSAFTSLPLSEYFRSVATWTYLKNIAFCVEYHLPGVFAENIYPNAVNGSLWSLPVEVLMYICVPIVLSLFHIRKNEKTNILPLIFTIAVIIVQICHMKYFPEARIVIYQTDWMQGLNLIPYYFIGMCFALYGERIKLNLQAAVPVILVRYCFSFSPVVNELFLMIFYSYIVFALALAEKPLFSEPFAKIEFSYGIFLWGFYVQQIVSMLISRNNWTVNQSLVLIICLAICVLMAWLSREIIEKPSLKLCKRIISGMNARATKTNDNRL